MPQIPSQQQKPQQDMGQVAAGAAQGHARAMTQHGAAISALHGNLMQMLSKLPQGADQGAAPDQGGQDQGGGDQTEQAIWQAFPSTDPNALQSLAQQAGGDLSQVVEQWAAMSEQDQQDFDHRQLQNLMQLISAMGQGGGPPPEAAGMPAQGPGVGGEGGY